MRLLPLPSVLRPRGDLHPDLGSIPPRGPARQPRPQRPRTVREVLLRQRVRLLLPAVVVGFVYLAQPTPRAFGLGIAIALVGLFIRAAAAGYVTKSRILATSGPYAFARHPLYLGSTLIGAGFLVAARSGTAALLGAGYWFMFFPATMGREEEKLRQRFGGAFDEYVARVSRFWPRRLPARNEGSGFSWRLYLRNREFQAALGVAAGIAVLWLKMSNASWPFHAP
jgi:protein-S-isoprenylcysteine O-methyltransferase Ste14